MMAASNSYTPRLPSTHSHAQQQQEQHHFHPHHPHQHHAYRPSSTMNAGHGAKLQTYAHHAHAEQTRSPLHANDIWHGPSSTTRKTIDETSSASTSSTPFVGQNASTTMTTTSATGKKRKRLQRACQNCHKAKRRCDGGLPCSNCDFSGRTCAYSDSQGKAVPPTKRSLRPSEAAAVMEETRLQTLSSPQHRESSTHDTLHAAQVYHPASSSPTSSMHFERHAQPAPTTLYATHSYGIAPRPAFTTAPTAAFASSSTSNAFRNLAASSSSSSPPTSFQSVVSQTAEARGRRDGELASSTSQTLEPSPDVRRELLSMFFAEVQPWSCIVDEITILRDLSSMTASPAVMFAIYALTTRHALRLCHKQPRYARLTHELGDGTTFAAEARRALQRENASTGMSALDDEMTLETRQALCLLACFEFDSGRLGRALSYVQACCKSINVVSHMPSSRQSHLQSQLDKRVACFTIVLDLCVAFACGRSPLLRTWEVQSALDALEQQTSSPSLESRRKDDNECLTDAVVHLAHMVLIFSNALDIHRRAHLSATSSFALLRQSSAELDEQVRSCEQHLQRWAADRLHGRLCFDEENLRLVERALHEQGHDTIDDEPALSPAYALCWCATHLFAESTVIVLQNCTNDAPSMAAAHNVQLILERANPSTFSGAMTAFGIVMLTSISFAGLDAVYRDARSTPGSSSTKEEVAAAWRALCRSSEHLQSDARLDDKHVSNVVSWLDMSAKRGHRRRRDEEGDIAAPSHEHARSAMSTQPSWTVGRSSLSTSTAAPLSFREHGQQRTRRSHSSEHDDCAYRGRESTSPAQSSASLNGRVPSLIKSRHSSTASSTTTASSLAGVGANGASHLPSIAQWGALSDATMSTQPKSAASNTLPPIRFSPPSGDVRRRSREWSETSYHGGDDDGDGDE